MDFAVERATVKIYHQVYYMCVRYGNFNGRISLSAKFDPRNLIRKYLDLTASCEIYMPQKFLGIRYLNLIIHTSEYNLIEQSGYLAQFFYLSIIRS